MLTGKTPKNCSGFTLLEMIIVMAVFTVVIIIAGKSFDLVVRQANIVSKSEESNIEGMIGLEIFRRDLIQAGFGLFTDVSNPLLTYTEASSLPGKAYNDEVTYLPRAVVAGNNVSATGVLANSDYLALKGTSQGDPRNKVSQKWSYIDGVSSTMPKVWGGGVDFNLNDNMIVVRQVYRSGVITRTLINDPSSATPFSTTYNTAAMVAPYIPPAGAVQYYYYGISADDVPKRPFNRSDYYVKLVGTELPTSCSPATGVLTKASLNPASGVYTYFPILDCVADMQIVFGWNTSGITSNVDYYTSPDSTQFSGSTTPAFPVDMNDPAYIRQHLKLIKVYILAQDGTFDKNFTNTSTGFVVGDVDMGEAALTRTVDLTAASMKNYRWKLYKLVVRPNNLN
ncbi:MAG: type II secretion system protein [Geobacteraceae bacterium]|nr:type II secretion system protein [Geobacteraceae bacterium]